MRHVGDITKLSGYELPVVDCITGGSPCQDLSVAGKRAGLDGERSGLFMEQIRIVKEMRERDRNSGRSGWAVRPRYMVWENVPGAFSSNGGKDFQAVLTEIVRIAEPDAPDVPMPVQGGWTKSGCLYSPVGQWSVAWRVHDAQFWGVPQRRKRIALVADFGGLSAPEILFERNGLSGDSEPGTAPGEGTAEGTGTGADRAVILAVHQNSSGEVRESDVAYTIGTTANASGRNTPLVYEQHSQDAQTVRRLTPLECERLQGYPDGWTDIGEWTDSKGKLHKESSDSARYKALGNSIAIPFWFWLLRRISAQYERPATLGSLFDGIGGFPLCWERCNGEGTAIWASEIEEFPIAVTKRRFPEKGESNGNVCDTD